MSVDETLVPSGVRIALVGAIIWLGLLASVLLNVVRLSIFDLLFLLAPLVVVPLTLRLIPVTQNNLLTRLVRNALLYLMLTAEIFVVASFRAPAGWLAGAATFPWLMVALALAIDGLARLVRTRLQSFPEFCFAVGEGYALVGGLWLLASRLGLQPVGFHEPIVLLTAVHFHFAGLMAAVLAGLVALSARATPLLRIALSCAVLGPGLLGLAFLVGPKLKLAAVGLVLIGELGIAFGTFSIGWAEVRKAGGLLLIAGSGCVIFGMVLAAIWAIGEYPLHAFVNLEQMARYHGVLNSIGFGLCSLMGWTLLRTKPAQS